MESLPDRETPKKLESAEKKKLPKKTELFLDSDNVYSEDFVMKVKDPVKEKRDSKKKKTKSK